MRSELLPFAVATVAVVLLSGCTAAEKKLGRGINNLMEPTRMGEIQRSYEQGSLFGGDHGGTTGFIRGVHRTIGRTVVGAVEVLSFPIPSDPYVFPDSRVHADSYKPNHKSSTVMGTDTRLGFEAGTDPFAWAPGSRFSVFE